MSHPRDTSASTGRLEVVSRPESHPGGPVRRTPGLRDVVAAARDGDGAERAAALEQLARSSLDPRAFAWFWLAARDCDDDAFAQLVALVPPGVELLPRVVLLLADDLARPSCPHRAPSHAALLGRLAPDHSGSHDVATLIATAPGCDPQVLAAALRLLAAAGHPSRAALLRTIGRTVAGDAVAADHAAAVAASLLPLLDREEAALVERWTATTSAGPAEPSQPSAQSSAQSSGRQSTVLTLWTSLGVRARRDGGRTRR